MSRNLTILPADTYTVINKTVITSNDKKIITMLYQPIIGYTACSLYFTLLDDLDKKEQVSNPITHHHLMAIMQLKLEEIVKAREKLEAIGLLKSYLKKESVNKYVYLLFSPLSAKEEYDKLVNYYKVPRISLKDYEDITLSFDDVFSPIAGRSIDVQDDIVKKNSNSILLNKCIDFDFLISSIPKEMVNEKCFSSDIKELINSLAFTYNIDDDTMISLVRDSLNEKGNIDKTILRKSCRNYYQFEEAGRLPTMVYHRQPDYLKKPVGDSSKWAKMVYTFENISPYDYLRAKYKGAEPTARDLRLIENLLIDQKLAPGVVNVLLAYVLKINNQKLNKSYIETIVGQWKRLNIETVEDAMKITEKEHKKMKKIIGKETPKRTSSKKVEQLPAWFDKDLDKTTPSDEEQDELDRILQELV